MTIPEFYPELARLFAKFFRPPKPGSSFESVMESFAASEPTDALAEVMGDALMILGSESRLREFRGAMRELQVDFTQWRPGMSPDDWLLETAAFLSAARNDRPRRG